MTKARLSRVERKVAETMVNSLNTEINKGLDFLKDEYGYDGFFCNLPLGTKETQDFINALKDERNKLLAKL